MDVSLTLENKKSNNKCKFRCLSRNDNMRKTSQRLYIQIDHQDPNVLKSFIKGVFENLKVNTFLL